MPDHADRDNMKAALADLAEREAEDVDRFLNEHAELLLNGRSLVTLPPEAISVDGGLRTCLRLTIVPEEEVTEEATIWEMLPPDYPKTEIMYQIVKRPFGYFVRPMRRR